AEAVRIGAPAKPGRAGVEGDGRHLVLLALVDGQAEVVRPAHPVGVDRQRHRPGEGTGDEAHVRHAYRRRGVLHHAVELVRLHTATAAGGLQYQGSDRCGIRRRGAGAEEVREAGAIRVEEGARGEEGRVHTVRSGQLRGETDLGTAQPVARGVEVDRDRARGA